MTVRELFEKLEAADPDAWVFLEDGVEAKYVDIQTSVDGEEVVEIS